MEYVFRPLVHVKIPDLDKAVWIIRCGGALGVRGQDQFGKLKNELNQYYIGENSPL